MQHKYLHEQEAFLLSTPELREQFNRRYLATSSLYYKGQPPFDELLDRIRKHIERL